MWGEAVPVTYRRIEEFRGSSATTAQSVQNHAARKVERSQLYSLRGFFWKGRRR